MDKKRLGNYGLWLSIAAFIPMLLRGFGVDILPDNYNDIVNAFLGILVMLGIINNPISENKWYLDDSATTKPGETKQETTSTEENKN